MWIDSETTNEIREFVQGVFAGIAIAGKTREDVWSKTNNEYRFNWNSVIDILVYKDDYTKDWCVIAHQCNDYSQFNGNEHRHIIIGDKWT